MPRIFKKDLGKQLITHPFVEVRPLIMDNGEPSPIYSISENSQLYKNGKPARMFIDENGRAYCNCNLGDERGTTHYPAYRLAKIAFDDDPKPYRYYKDLDCNHIDPSIPLDNHISNLEFISSKENMKKAAIEGCMVKDYSLDTVHKICQMIADKVPRLQIRKELNLPGSIIDDIRSGKSHRTISEQYVDKGFEYHKFDRAAKEKEVREICELLVKGYEQCEIIKMGYDHNLVWFVANRRTWTYVSKDYDF